MLYYPRLDVRQYTEDSFPELLFFANREMTPLDSIKKKSQLQHFKIYFKEKTGINAKYILVESNYISKDYLSDYSSYYSTCFESYPKTCVRLHFFSSTKELEEFKTELQENIIRGITLENGDFWNKQYLGFMVIKPLPFNFIGFTLLKHYNHQKENECFNPTRFFWGTRSYRVHLFGTEIIYESLAFQEQDQNVSACATITIWSMLQKATENRYVILKSPSQITIDSGVTNNMGHRLMPNQGLTITTMANAIFKNNLVTEVRSKFAYSGHFNNYTKRIIYAYSSLGIPIIITMDPSDEKGLEGHCVAVCGHNLNQSIEDNVSDTQKRSFLDRVCKIFKKEPKKAEEGMKWIAHDITKLYVHDDQWGPFSKLKFVGDSQLEPGWSSYHPDTELPYSTGIMICLFEKIRITYDQIESIVESLHRIMMDGLRLSLEYPLSWDIQLRLSEHYKKEIQKDSVLDENDEVERKIKYYFLSNHYPKYIWVVKMYAGPDRLVDFIYDATGLVRSNLLHSILGYFMDFNIEIAQYLSLLEKDEAVQSVFDSFLKSYSENILFYQKI